MLGDRFIDADGDSLELSRVDLETTGDQAHYGARWLLRLEIQPYLDPHLAGPVSIVLGQRAALALADAIREAAAGLPDSAYPPQAPARGGSRADGPLLRAE